MFFVHQNVPSEIWPEVYLALILTPYVLQADAKQ